MGAGASATSHPGAVRRDDKKSSIALLDLLTDEMRRELVDVWGLTCISWVNKHLDGLHTDASSSRVSEEAFTKWIGLPGDPEKLAKLLWSACDVKQRGLVTAAEVISFCATFADGSPRQRADLAFRICDVERCGSIGCKDIIAVRQAVLEALADAAGKDFVDCTLDNNLFANSLMLRLAGGCTEDESSAADLSTIRVSHSQWCQAFTEGVGSEEPESLRGFIRDFGVPRPKPVRRRACSGQVPFGQIFGLQARLALQIMTALELTASNVATDCEDSRGASLGEEKQTLGGVEVTAEDYNEVMMLNIPADKETPRCSQRFRILAYAPTVFRGLRKLEGVGDTEFCASVGVRQFYSCLMLGETSMLTDFPSPAKSRCCFFVSPDQELLVKTIHEGERKQLTAMLPQYVDHLLKHPKSLITRYLGLYTMTLHDGQSQFDFVVMRNLLVHAGPSITCYDVKGCHNRDDVKPGMRLLCDASWIERGEVLGLTPALTSAFLAEFESDVRWLAQENLMDYSLFVVFSTAQPCEDRETVSDAAQGSAVWLQLPSQGGRRCASLGIIDVLTAYGAAKTIESQVKSIFALGEDVVCVSPDMYGERFRTFVAQHVISIQGERTLSEVESAGFGKASKRLRWSNLTGVKKFATHNANRISHYVWLSKLLQMILDGSGQLAVRGSTIHQRGTPLFVVAGACPNHLSPMQAMVYCQMQDAVDFWWVKPQKDDASCLEWDTLSRNVSGPHKNAPGMSKTLYAPLAQKFTGACDGDFSFGIDRYGRAFIDEVDDADGTRRMFLYLIWQETWSELFAQTKFIQGKLFYQKGEPGHHGLEKSTAEVFYARQYRICGSQLCIMDVHTEEVVPSMLPPDSLQEMYDMPD